MPNSYVVAVVPAAGIGARMQADRPKQYLTLAKKTILEHTLSALHAHPKVQRVIVAISPNDAYFKQIALANAPWLTRVYGGDTRAESVRAALAELADEEWALVHDAARPCIRQRDISRLIALTDNTNFSGGILATPVRDTMKRSNGNAAAPCVASTESRDDLWHALTPQLFRAKPLQDALDHSKAHGLNVTDEASAMEAMGYTVQLIDSDPANIKITRPADLPLAQFYLQQGNS